jgi:hypothetical protein
MVNKGNQENDFFSRFMRIMELMQGKESEMRSSLAGELLIEYNRLLLQCEEIEDIAERDQLKREISDSIARLFNAGHFEVKNNATH